MEKKEAGSGCSIVFIYAPHNAHFVALSPTSFQRSHSAELMLKVPLLRSAFKNHSHEGNAHGGTLSLFLQVQRQECALLCFDWLAASLRMRLQIAMSAAGLSVQPALQCTVRDDKWRMMHDTLMRHQSFNCDMLSGGRVHETMEV